MAEWKDGEMNVQSNSLRRASWVAAGLLLAVAPAAGAFAATIDSGPRVLAECEESGGSPSGFPGSPNDGSFSMSCEPSVVPNTSTDDNLTEQEVAQPGYN
jgi:hypothetical protein